MKVATSHGPSPSHHWPVARSNQHPWTAEDDVELSWDTNHGMCHWQDKMNTRANLRLEANTQVWPWIKVPSHSRPWGANGAFSTQPYSASRVPEIPPLDHPDGMDPWVTTFKTHMLWQSEGQPDPLTSSPITVDVCPSLSFSWASWGDLERNLTGLGFKTLVWKGESWGAKRGGLSSRKTLRLYICLIILLDKHVHPI